MALNERAIESSDLPNKSMRDRIGYLLRAADKLSGPGLAIGDQYYCPDAGSCVWMLCKQQTRDGVAPVLVVGETEKWGEQGNWFVVCLEAASTSECLDESLRQPGPSGTDGRELQWWNVRHRNALRNAARCDAFDGSSKREDGATVRQCDREPVPVVRAERGGGFAVAAV